MKYPTNEKTRGKEDDRLTEVAQRISDGVAFHLDEQPTGARQEVYAILRQMDTIRRMALFYRTDEHLSDSVDDPDPIPDRWSHLLLIEKLGEGGFGEVFHAWDPRLEREVALKLIRSSVGSDPARRDSILREGRLLARIDHPHVIPVYGIDEYEGRIGIWMKYIAGQTLEESLELHGPFGAEEAAVIGATLCRALAAVHNAGVIHRDVKAENVMRAKGGQILLMDFGIGVQVESLSMDPMERLAGTPYYLAPELLEGGLPNKRTDIYSLGVLLYHLVTGSFPVKADNLKELTEAHRNNRIRLLRDTRPDLPGWFVKAIERATAARPEDRFTTPGEMELALEPHAGETPTIQTRPGRWVGTPGARKLKLTVGVMSLASLLGLGLGFVGIGFDMQPSWSSLTSSVELPQQMHIAILPFYVAAGTEEDSRILQGLLETLSSRLSQVESSGELWVIPLAEIRERGVKSPGEARRVLGANLALTGSLTRHARGLLLTVNLVDTGSLRQLDSITISEIEDGTILMQNKILSELIRILGLSARGTRVQVTGVSEQASQYYLQALGYLQDYDRVENIDQAMDLFHRAIKEDARFVDAYAGLGLAYFHKYSATDDKRWLEPAIENSARAVAMDEENVTAHVTLGRIRIEQGDDEAARIEFERALQLDPSETEAYRGLARTFENQESFERAEETYQRAVTKRPGYWATYNDLGAFYFRQNRFPEAVAQFQQVVHLAPQNAWGWTNLGAAYYNLGLQQESKKAFETAIESYPVRDAYTNLATIEFYDGNYDLAAELYERALSIQDGGEYSTWSFLANACFYSFKKRDQVERPAQRALDLAFEELARNEQDPAVLADIANLHALLGEEEEARNYLKRVIGLDTARVEVYFTNAVTFALLGERDNAVQWLRKAADGGFPHFYIQTHPGLIQVLGTEKLIDLLGTG